MVRRGEQHPGDPEHGLTARDIIAVGASAGGITPLCELVRRLPGDLPAAMLVVVHRYRTASCDKLPELLQRYTQLAVVPALDGDEPLPAHVHVGPPGQHVRMVAGRFRVGEELDVHPGRASVDVLFRSAAAEYGYRLVAVVLSGALNDGTAGLREVRRTGGIAIVQDPSVAEYPSMPESAMDAVPVHFCLAIPALADTLVTLARGAAPAPRRTRVLIVERERVVALLIETRLADVGYDVVGSVSTCEAAVCIAAVVAPDVVVVDVQFAEAMLDLEAARALWVRFGLPLVYLTFRSDERTAREAAAMQCGFVVKPVRAAQLHAAIQLAIERRHRA